MRRGLWGPMVALVALGASAALGQQGQPSRAGLVPVVKRGAERYVYPQNGDMDGIQNVPYDGRFTFVRIKFNPLNSGYSWRRDNKWDHDTPRAERHFMKILRELSTLMPYMDGGNIVTLDDPNLFKYPVAYLCEPGFWTLDARETKGLHDYLVKGGFLIIDDFAGGHWTNFEEQIRKVLPGYRLVPLDASHPIFDSFFHIASLDYMHPYYQGFKSEFYGIFEDNDPKKRLMVIANYNNDIGEYWEWSDTGMFPVALSNEGYKLGVNYVMYALTH